MRRWWKRGEKTNDSGHINQNQGGNEMTPEEQMAKLEEEINKRAEEKAKELGNQQQHAVFDRLTNTLERFEASLNKQPEPPPKKEAPIEDVSDEDYRAARQKAMQEGDWSVVDKMEKIREKAREERLRREHKREMDSLRGELSQGTEILSQLSFEVNKSKMPHYDVLEKEMQAALAQLPANQRANPVAVQSVYNYVAGSPEGLAKIENKWKESFLRQQSQEDPPGPGTGSSREGASGSSTGVPPPEKLLSKDNLDALAAAGKTPQQWADEQVRRNRCKDYEEYYETVWKPYYGEAAQS